MGKVTNFQSVVRDLEAVVDTAAYADGDVLFDRVAVVVAHGQFRDSGLRGEITQICLRDKNGIGGDLDLVFLDQDVSLGTVNAAPSISAAGAQAILGIVRVRAAQYSPVGGIAIATVRVDDIPFALPAGGTIWVAAVSRAAQTYPSTDAISLRVGCRVSNVMLL